MLIPGQTESWWGYEKALPLLAEHFEAFAVDLRGQGRSSRTPGRYTLDNFGNDLVRFIDLVIGRPTIVSGLSSGGVLSAWLSAYAKPGQVIAAVYEDPPLFASEVRPATAPGISQGIGPLFDLWSTYLGDQWSIGAWDAMREAAPERLPEWLEAVPFGDEPAQNLKEYDPEWGRAFWTGTVGASCDHERMLRSVKVPVLLTHHFRVVSEATGDLMGAMTDQQAQRVQDILTARERQRRVPVVPRPSATRCTTRTRSSTSTPCSTGRQTWACRDTTTMTGQSVGMTDEPPIINLDVNASDAAAARTLIKGMLETEGWDYKVELPADPNELGRLVLALAHEAALLAFQVHVDHPDTPAVKIVDMLAANEPRRGLRVVDPD